MAVTRVATMEFAMVVQSAKYLVGEKAAGWAGMMVDE